jgi:hypothetical protein
VRLTRPAFPAPSDAGAGRLLQNSGALRHGIVSAYLKLPWLFEIQIKTPTIPLWENPDGG